MVVINRPTAGIGYRVSFGAEVDHPTGSESRSVMRRSSTSRSRPLTSFPEVLRIGLFAAALLAAALLSVRAHADQNDPRLDALFAELADSPHLAHALGVERRIWDIWIDHEDPVTRDAMRRAGIAMEQRRLQEALAGFSKVIGKAPEFAEAWNKRATVYYMLGDHEKSVADVIKALRLESRHFGALSGLALIYGRSGQPLAAVKALRRALEIHPQMAHGKARLRVLEKEVGKAI